GDDEGGRAALSVHEVDVQATLFSGEQGRGQEGQRKDATHVDGLLWGLVLSWEIHSPPASPTHRHTHEAPPPPRVAARLPRAGAEAAEGRRHPRTTTAG